MWTCEINGGARRELRGTGAVTCRDDDLERLRSTSARPFKSKAIFLYADTLYVQSQYARAKVIYQKLHSELNGYPREIAAKKIAACNKELNLPQADGIND